MKLLLKGWIAMVDPTAKRPRFARCAVTARILPRAGRPFIERACGGRSEVKQEISFRTRNEQGVAVLEESAASAAQAACRSQSIHFAIELIVELAQLARAVQLERLWIIA